ncbi:MAG: hypothetical protein HY678_12735 [Chloroflexi bacterium]|nr:hypothetical protein [Chloroflexota bacterium]
MDHDEIAAYVCALTALCALAGRYVAVGDPLLGFIVLPSVEVWGRGEDGRRVPWAEEALAANLTTVREDGRVSNGGEVVMWRDGRRWGPRA